MNKTLVETYRFSGEDDPKPKLSLYLWGALFAILGISIRFVPSIRSLVEAHLPETGASFLLGFGWVILLLIAAVAVLSAQGKRQSSYQYLTIYEEGLGLRPARSEEEYFSPYQKTEISRCSQNEDGDLRITGDALKKPLVVGRDELEDFDAFKATLGKYAEIKEH